MSTFTCTSRIKEKVDLTARFDMSTFNPCKVHGRSQESTVPDAIDVFSAAVAETAEGKPTVNRPAP